MANPKYFTNEDPDPVGAIYQQMAGLAQRVDDLEREVRNQYAPPPLSRVDPITHPNPYEGQRAIDPADEQHMWYSNGEWRKAGGNPVYAIKVFEDDKPNIVKNRAFVWEIPEDLDGGMIVRAGAFITTTGSNCIIDIAHDGGSTILDSNITIPAGNLSSLSGHTATCSTTVAWGDQFTINTLAAGGKGLGIWVVVANATAGGTTLKGAKGDPGGLSNFTGAWTTTTVYHSGDIVVDGGIAYIATANHTSGSTTEPGVGASWQTVWAPLLDLPLQTSLNVTVATQLGQSFIAPGIKGYKRMPFAGTITEVTLLADTAGSMTWDIWKTTYSGHPGSSANSIVASAPPTLSAQTKNTDTILTGWTTAVAAGDIFTFIINNPVSLIKTVDLEMKVVRT